jgi:Fe/S biogenesis protein NfuA
MWVDTVLTVTDAAVEKAVLVRARETEPDRFALWVEVAGVQAGEYSYDLSLQPLADAPPDAHVQDHGRIAVVIPAESIEALRGATLDREGDLMTGGLVLQNHTPASPAVGTQAPTADLSGDTAQRVVRVLTEQINPAIAAHGGVAELVAVEADTAYLRLGGGCVGCGMVSVTLRQGIEVALRDAVPSVTRVIDVTDHSSGTNPYYEPAAK